MHRNSNWRSTCFENLHQDVLLHTIVKFLDIKEVSHALQTSKKFLLLDKSQLWQLLVERDFPPKPHILSPSPALWKNTYKERNEVQWSSNKSSYLLSNHGLTVWNPSAELSNCSCILSTFGFTEGKHYWEITVDWKSDDGVDILIGVNHQKVKTTAWVAYNGWGYGSAGTITNVNENILCSTKSYGKPFKTGDIIGVLLDLTNKRSLKYFKNGIDLGFAIEDKLLEEYPIIYPAVTVGGSSTVFSEKVSANFRAVLQTETEDVSYFGVIRTRTTSQKEVQITPSN